MKVNQHSSQYDVFNVYLVKCIRQTNWILLGLISVCSSVTAVPSDNLRLTLDLSARLQHTLNLDQTSYVQTIGMDSHKVFTGKLGDWATLTAQLYLKRIDNLLSHPKFYDDAHDWKLTYRIFNINFTALPGSLPNIKVGHIELPFGLEHTINTNGDFRDYLNGRNLGVKADWGIGFNKQHEIWEYEFSFTSGGGQELDKSSDSFIAAGRIGTSRNEDYVLGVSVYKGQFYNKAFYNHNIDNNVFPIIERQRVAFDWQYYQGLWGAMFELAVGENSTRKQLNALLEINWRNAIENGFIYVQYQFFSENRKTDSQQTAAKLVIGVQYLPDNHWDLSSILTHDLNQLDDMKTDTRLGLQIRYRF